MALPAVASRSGKACTSLGASLTELTLTVTVVSADSSNPSLARNLKLSAPLKSLFGV